MDHEKEQDFVRAQIAAQQRANKEQLPISILEQNDEFVLSPGTVAPADVPLLFTAYPIEYEQVSVVGSQRYGLIYNGYDVRFTRIYIGEDQGEEGETELTTEVWSIGYAQEVRAFLNRVLPG